MNRPMPPDSRRFNWSVPVALIAVAAIAALVWLRLSERNGPAPDAPVALAPTPAPAASAPTPPEPKIKHPVDAIAVDPTPAKDPLPPRDKSDGPALDAAGTLADKSQVQQQIFDESLIRRFVATIDNLPRETLPMRIRVFRGTPGAFLTEGPGEKRAIAPENEARYRPVVLFVKNLDPSRLVSIYLRFYPLLQEEFRALGYPDKEFNDRLVEAIDDMLAAPEPIGPIELVQPKVMYQFADPALEKMSAGRKIMVRIGIDNARTIKAKLREIRAILTTNKPD